VRYEIPGRLLTPGNASVYLTGTDLFIIRTTPARPDRERQIPPAVGGSGAVGIDFGNSDAARQSNFGNQRGILTMKRTSTACLIGVLALSPMHRLPRCEYESQRPSVGVGELYLRDAPLEWSRHRSSTALRLATHAGMVFPTTLVSPPQTWGKMGYDPGSDKAPSSGATSIGRSVKT